MARPKSIKTASEEPSTKLPPADTLAAERTTKFDRLDKDKHGKLTLEEYKSRQSDPGAAAKRFEKLDGNKDGFITREEYIQNGSSKLEK